MKRARNKENKINNKRASAGIEIVLLVLAIFAFAYFVHESLPLVKADDVSLKCCEETVDGAPCQDIVDEDDCAAGANLVPSKCEETSWCRLGCCIDDYEGTYDPNVPQSSCPSPGRWEDDKNCLVPGAELGCCVLGNMVRFVTDTQCSRLSELQGLEKDYRSNLNEAQCIALTMMQEIGACVLPGGNCRFISGQECVSSTGNLQNFHKDYLCTAPELNTNCEKTDKTTCIDGKDGVYFLDTCGNPANIYDSSKVNDDNYWSGVISFDDSCGSTSSSGNAESVSCGNCNRFFGGICASAAEDNFNVNNGDFYCRDTSCEYKGETYRNGESWCVYDSKIGDDVVGSRHWKYVCNQGRTDIEPCADYRNQICEQHNTDIGDGEVFRDATCRVNNWRACLVLNSDGGGISECEETLDCKLHPIYVDEYFKFDVCVPKYPGGLNFDAPGNGAVCGMASQTCTVYYQQHLECDGLKCSRIWKCEENCHCEKSGFTQQMNNLCRSLGDCGGDVNIEKKSGRSGYSVSGAPPISLNQYKSNAEPPVEGEYIQVGDLTQYSQAAGLVGTSIDGYEPEEEFWEHQAAIGGGAAGVGFALAYLSWSGPGLSVLQTAEHALEMGASGTGAWAGFTNALMAAGTAIILTGVFADWAGLNPMLSEIAVYVAITAAVLLSVYTEIGAMYAGLWGAVIAVAIMYLVSLFGIGDTEERYVTFTCKPWQPPLNGDDCEECNKDPLKPCSEYRCRSLGAPCELINKGTTQEMCVDNNPDDATPPTIGPQYSTISATEKYSDITDTGFKIEGEDEECLEAYTSLTFGINTNEPAHCKYDSSMKDFDDMAHDFGTNAHVYNHTIYNFILPDPSHGQSQGLDWTGDTTIYAKCVDTHGNIFPSFYTIDMCVKEADDITAPRIQKTEPENDALVGYNATSKNVKIYTNEPANCSWSLQDKTYNLMENPMDCKNNFMLMTVFGYMCNSSLPINSSENVFYFRCKDQPWLEGTEQSDERNANQQSETYVLRRPENPLKIDWIEPGQDFEVATSPATVVLKAQTSGGAGDPQCSWQAEGYSLVPFYNTFSTLHEQSITMYAGGHKIYVECEDIQIGDIATGETEFRIIHDARAPQVIRVYVQDGSLNIITNEDAECVYSTESCTYDFADGTDISGTEKEHSVTVRKGKTYYVKCRDRFGNLPDSGVCSTTVAYI